MEGREGRGGVGKGGKEREGVKREEGGKGWRRVGVMEGTGEEWE